MWVIRLHSYSLFIQIQQFYNGCLEFAKTAFKPYWLNIRMERHILTHKKIIAYLKSMRTARKRNFKRDRMNFKVYVTEFNNSTKRKARKAHDPPLAF